MARKPEKILKKTTQSGITIMLLMNIVIKKYSDSYSNTTVFPTHKEAKKHFNLFRQSHKFV